MCVIFLCLFFLLEWRVECHWEMLSAAEVADFSGLWYILIEVNREVSVGLAIWQNKTVSKVKGILEVDSVEELANIKGVVL